MMTLVRFRNAVTNLAFPELQLGVGTLWKYEVSVMN